MINRKPRVLIVDDEQVVCDVLRDELSERGYLCTAVLNGNDALAKIGTEDFDVVLLDIRLPGMSGMDVLREIWLNHSAIVTIMITAVGDANTAVEAMKLGASDYIVKPFDLDKVVASMSSALETRRVTGKPPTTMDAIARGVEIKLDPLSSYSNIVTQRTVDIARRLGVAEKEIQEWVKAKAILEPRKSRTIKSSQNKTK